jgi:hypothetical protein
VSRWGQSRLCECSRQTARATRQTRALLRLIPVGVIVRTSAVLVSMRAVDPTRSLIRFFVCHVRCSLSLLLRARGLISRRDAVLAQRVARLRRRDSLPREAQQRVNDGRDGRRGARDGSRKDPRSVRAVASVRGALSLAPAAPPMRHTQRPRRRPAAGAARAQLACLPPPGGAAGQTPRAHTSRG